MGTDAGGDRASGASIVTIVIVIVAALAGARTAHAQLVPPIDSPGSRSMRCNATVSHCDAYFASALAWRGGDSFAGRSLDVPQAAEGSGSHWLIGAIGGFVAGATVTYFVLHSGGSTSRCDRDANQDALNRGECAGLVALGGLVGAGAGAWIGSRFRSDAMRLGSVRGLDIGSLPGGRMTVAGKWVH